MKFSWMVFVKIHTKISDLPEAEFYGIGGGKMVEHYTMRVHDYGARTARGQSKLFSVKNIRSGNFGEIFE